MEPIFGFMLYFVATLIVSIIASKRGRSGLLVFIACVAGGFVLAILINNVGGSSWAGLGAFLAPVAALIWALSASTSSQLAVEHGSHGDYKKCPFCAEPVRREAIKCKHCGSALGDAQSSTPVTTSAAAPVAAVTPAPPAAGSEVEAMDELGISFVDGKYVFGEYRYDRLNDAITYARRTSGVKS